MSELKRVPLDEIVVNPEEHIRVAIPDVARRYAELKVYENAPIELIDIEGELHLAQGNNRIAAARMNSENDIPAFVEKGTAEDVTIRSITGNATHGMPLTNTQLREGVLRLKSLRPKWSGTKMAEEMGVDRQYVLKTLAAERVRRMMKRDTRLSWSALVDISYAPEEYQRDLVIAAEKNRWPVIKIREAIASIRNGDDSFLKEGRDPDPHGDIAGSDAKLVSESEAESEAWSITKTARNVRQATQVMQQRVKNGALDELNAFDMEDLIKDLSESAETISGIADRVGTMVTTEVE